MSADKLLLTLLLHKAMRLNSLERAKNVLNQV
ncbi:hypothetical protein AF72_10620 [Xylella taiwanensis]|uniref:Uncharacterized protein n=1 Tax=Xylella taiwanensis TaxID=1444770 RepID=Z9JGM6_9GAMM|nr:hypothetical protein AF72_10620 [Xylella taiwanensis]